LLLSGGFPCDVIYVNAIFNNTVEIIFSMIGGRGLKENNNQLNSPVIFQRYSITAWKAKRF
jgi:hypothetical protein